MANFTMELRTVIETVYGTDFDTFNWEQPYQDVVYQGISYRHLPTVPDNNWDAIGLGYYPIFDEAYRNVLNGKIISNFFMREIGVETIDLWKQFMQTKMQNIMPYYNKLYDTELIKYGALDSMRISSQRVDTAHAEANDNSTNSTESDNTAKSRAVSSSTPQNMLSGSEDYATGATDSNSSGTVKGNGTAESTSVNDAKNTGNSLTTGYQGAASDLVMKYRNSLLNIDTMIFANLQELFMSILNTSDDYFNTDWIF